VIDGTKRWNMSLGIKSVRIPRQLAKPACPFSLGRIRLLDTTPITIAGAAALLEHYAVVREMDGLDPVSEQTARSLGRRSSQA
jgi:hypothetical protein